METVRDIVGVFKLITANEYIHGIKHKQKKVPELPAPFYSVKSTTEFLPSDFCILPSAKGNLSEVQDTVAQSG